MFLELKSVQRLKKLSESPIDLSLHLTKERVERMNSQNAGWKLLFATERVDEEVLEALFALSRERRAVESMVAMQEGKIINQIEGYDSERRAVLHTATRDFFKDPVLTHEANVAREEAYKEVEKLEAFAESCEEKEYSDIIQIGIGGSDLGPKALWHALKVYQKKPTKVHFLSNVDPDSATKILREVHLEKTLVISISKSGTTLETLANEERIRSAFLKKGIDPKEHIIGVTMKKSPMDDSSRYLALFYLWDFIGGRYSATSMVGGVLLSLTLGFDIYWELLEGAHHMDVVAREKQGEDNLPLLGALLAIWNRNFLQHSSLAIIPYIEALSYFPSHVQQLDMESNGKTIDKKGERVEVATGPMIFGGVGTDAQHSFFQSLHQGYDTIPLEFIGSMKSQYGEDFLQRDTLFQEKLLSNLFAQAIALAMGQKSENPNKAFKGNKPSHLLLTERIDPYRLGALLSYYEHKTAFQGFLWNINSFDQEGVQLGKKLADQMMEQFRAKRVAPPAPSFPLGEAFLDQLEDFS